MNEPIPTTSFLTDPDKYLGLFTPEQVQQEYPNQFMKTSVDRTPLVFELSPQKQEQRETEKERFLLTNKSLFTITSEGDYNIWDLDMTDDTILRTLAVGAIPLGIRSSKLEEPKDIIVNVPGYDKKIKITHLPPTPKSSEYIKDTLNIRKQLLQEKV